LYDGVINLEVVVDSNSTITPGNPDIISDKKKIVAYGTSIMQGGCASRTGMASTNIISRALNCEVVNLGFSGDGKMDSCLARAMASIPNVDCYILDPVPNCTEMMCDTLTCGFVNLLRTLRPEVPIVMVEGPIYPYARHDSYFGNYLPKKNAAYRKNYDLLKKENPENLYYVTSELLDGVEDDGTVDGIHLTDLGFKYYAEKLIPVLKQILK
ncbi:MAG: hydrolase, partial [Muribaculaceae bacterium]|nr:hydrolase [Muribaculaceae bacterium]